MQLVTQIIVKYFDFELKIQWNLNKLYQKKCKGKCACDCNLENKFHTDHIIPFSNNGTNEI